MCRRERMRVVSLEGVSESSSGGSFLGFIRVLILVWVRVWGVPMRLIGSGMISVLVPCQCERSAFAKGVYYFILSWWVSVRLELVQYFH
jgi:hypothetical protein